MSDFQFLCRGCRCPVFDGDRYCPTCEQFVTADKNRKKQQDFWDRNTLEEDILDLEEEV